MSKNKSEYDPFKSKSKSAVIWHEVMASRPHNYDSFNPSEKISWMMKQSLENHNNMKQQKIIAPSVINNTRELRLAFIDFIESQKPDTIEQLLYLIEESSKFEEELLPIVRSHDQSSRVSEFSFKQSAKSLGGNVFQFFIDMILREFNYKSLRPKEIKEKGFEKADFALTTEVVGEHPWIYDKKVFVLLSAKHTLKERHAIDNKYTLLAAKHGVRHGIITLDKNTALNNPQFRNSFDFCFVTDDVYALLEPDGFFHPISSMNIFLCSLEENFRRNQLSKIDGFQIAA